MIIPSQIRFKDGHEKELLDEYQQLNPVAQLIAEDMAAFFRLHGQRLIITDIISNAAEDKRLNRISSSHREGRAFDFRINGLPQEFLDQLEKRFENLYKDKAAISKETGQPNLILYHDNGNGKHGHCQIRRGL